MSLSKSFIFSLFIVPLLANPILSEVTSGQATLTHIDAQTIFVQTEQEKTVIKWKDFSVQSGESTHFMQPNASSVILNRVVGMNPSEILGQVH